MAYGLADVVQQRRLIDESEADETFKRVATAKLDALLGLAETAACRRVRLLAYFGEASEPCGNCDNCLAPPKTWDATEAARKALSCIYRTGQRFGVVHLMDVLRGKATERTARWGHDKLSVFGVGADLDEATWRSVFRQLVALGFARVDHDAHGALRLTDTSRAVLRGEQAVQMRPVVERAPRGRRAAKGARGGQGAAGLDGDAQAAGEAPVDTGLLERLKAWRRDQAREQGLPAYVILHDRTLTEIARRRPESMAVLGEIPGIGEHKLARYGAQLLELSTTA
jgi:ATP-dependent DNA helicase RecQ